MTPEEINARLLHRDGLILVIDKPAGVAVHRGPKGGRCLEDDFDALRFGLPRNPSLAHRLDRDTSGCLVLGRHRKALEKLGLMFKKGQISKTYWAVVEGGPVDELGEIDLPLGRLDAERGWWMKVDPAGLPSRTLYRVLGRGHHGDAPLAWIEFQPLTGRTHQLRVHSSASGWPILGDPVYGGENRRNQDAPLHLHARGVTIPISNNKPAIAVTAPVPAHMQDRLRACGWAGETEPASPGQSLTGP
ncbi:MAG: Pseudouridine synthase [Hyphomicrobiales bacterium]|jgi:tRNA pseudouridine32 synthase/23S rRNA pseudouridine746 synthase|nr:Pseudouridine synthase [Hyphomicrobiales bacterium]